MSRHLIAAAAALAVCTATPYSDGVFAVRAAAQSGSVAVQPAPDVDQNGNPLFRVTIVGRSIPAVNYRPRTGETTLDFAGTSLMPEAEGRAEISGQRGYMRIEARFDDLEPASRFGPEYLTYVLWAITPEGRSANLGELQFRGDDRRLTVTTELQAFALIVTAEPYFAVTRPSDVVVLENVVRDAGLAQTRGRVETVDARYELLTRGTYLMKRNPNEFRPQVLDPDEPLDLAQARNAVSLSRLAGADRFAQDTFDKAVRLLAEAENAHERGRDGNDVTQPARQAAQTAEDARLIALERQEEAYLAEQRRIAEQREQEAQERARLEADLRREEQQRRLEAEEQRLQAERDRMKAEAGRMAAERERAAADAARQAAERERLEAERLRAEADAARAAAEAQASQTARAAEQAERERAQLREQLREQLNVVLETRETARGLIVSLSDVLFDVGSATLKPGARERLARVSGILAAYPGLTVQIEGHADATGSDDFNQQLSERRAESVRAFLTQQGTGPAVIVSTTGYGESRPVATNGTAAGRQMNRRVEIVVSGESIGVSGR